jgi:murein L,D-transpeptidase YcbB/YkuD
VTGGRVRPEAFTLIASLNGAGEDDLDPAAYRPAVLAREVAAADADRRPALLARAELDLSAAFTAYIADLHRSPPAAALKFVDPGVRLPSTDAVSILEDAAGAPSLREALAGARRMNPIYAGLRAALADSRARGGPDATAALIAANLERARALPPDLGARYILVNPAAETLWVFAGGQARGVMRVVVGKTDNQTPSMIGLIRYALFNPYWNIPPDLVRDKIAPKVLAGGPGVLGAQHLQALSDWTANAKVLDPASVDWQAVAAGRTVLRVRQSPGADNMMGKVKFMLPNPLGIYLHDTPLKGLFDGAVRTDSSGCVRLQDAQGLASWIFGRPVGAVGGAPDQRVDLAAPLPVYILYLTAQPSAAGVSYPPDIYQRDPALLAALAARSAGSAPKGR